MTQRTIKVRPNECRIEIPLKGPSSPYAVIDPCSIRGASEWGASGVNIYLVDGAVLSADLDESGFAALLRVIVSEYEQRALTKDDVASVTFA